MEPITIPIFADPPDLVPILVVAQSETVVDLFIVTLMPVIALCLA